MKDCFTCDFAKRDKYNRFIAVCSGSGNCLYSKFEDEIKPTLEEYICNLENNIVNSNKDYKQGFNDALTFIKTFIKFWNDTE